MDEMRRLLLITIFIILPFYGFSQTCCSAGAPILSAINVSSTNASQWQFSLTAEHNSIKDVLPTSLKPNQERFTNSAILDVSYGITDRFSASLILPYVQLSQTALFGTEGEKLTNGVGDIMAMIKYNIITSNIVDQRQLAIGFGVKFPTGKSDIRGDTGTILAPQLQPGTNSWDQVFWTFFSQSFRPNPFSIFSNLSVRINGNNNRFQTNGPFSSYHFGNVFTLAAGLSYRFTRLIDLSLQARYRHTTKDSFAGGNVLNTGGDWVYLTPAINLNFDPYGLRVSSQLPVFRDLTGIQITTSYTVSATLYFFIL